MKFAWPGIRSIEFTGTNTSVARLTATNGDAFAITLDADVLRVETAFGLTEMPVKLIRSVKVATSAGAAAAGAGTVRLAIELRDGSRVVGKGLDDSLSLHSQAMGDLKLAWPEIRSIEFTGASTDLVRLTATNGDVYEVQIETPVLRVETSFGKTELQVKLIRSVKVSMVGGGRLPSDMPSGLVSLWSGEGDCGDCADGNAGTLCGNAAFADGKVGQAFSFDGVNSSVKIPQSPNLNPGGQVTIAFWMKAAADNAMNSYQGLVTSDFYGISIANGRGGRLGVDFYLSTTGSRGTTSVFDFTETANANGGGAPVAAGQWHHVAGTYDGSRLQLYIDGRRGETPSLTPA